MIIGSIIAAVILGIISAAAIIGSLGYYKSFFGEPRYLFIILAIAAFIAMGVFVANAVIVAIGGVNIL